MRILLIEDEEKVASFIKKGLAQSAYTVDWASTGEEGLAYCATAGYHAVILDLMLPDRDGLCIVRDLRARNIDVPVLALTARAGIEDRIAGLDSGCDDYLTKPFAFAELLSRLRALLRRAATNRAPLMEYAGLTMDCVRRIVTRDGRKIELTTREYALLDLLLRHPERVFARSTLIEGVWGYESDSTSNVLDVYMALLRKKIDSPPAKKLLHTVRNVGYVLREEP